LSLDGAKSVRASHHQTPAGWPWIIHAAEGTDAAAGTEFERLESLGCLTANTVIVHGVALSREQQQRLVKADAGLVWCPSSNLHLFARTLDVRTLFAHQRVALGSDSRITGEQDLLGELRVAREVAQFDERSLEALVTEQPARLLRLPDRGVLKAGALGDLLVLPDGLPLSQASRADVRLVLIGGVVQYADPEYAEAFGCEADLAPVRVDGLAKYLTSSLVGRLDAAQVSEPGLDVSAIRAAATA
jgi:cytosine/adenosine deaminase-related metal-dependent hydrolase